MRHKILRFFHFQIFATSYFCVYQHFRSAIYCAHLELNYPVYSIQCLSTTTAILRLVAMTKWPDRSLAPASDLKSLVKLQVQVSDKWPVRSLSCQTFPTSLRHPALSFLVTSHCKSWHASVMYLACMYLISLAATSCTPHILCNLYLST